MTTDAAPPFPMTPTMPVSKGKLGIIAGGGGAPRQMIATCKSIDRPFFVIALEGHADADLVDEKTPHVWLPLGAGSRLKDLFASEGITELVMIGRVRRPSLSEIRADWWALKVLTKIGLSSLGDDGLLRAIGKVFEEECGVRVIGAHEVAADLLTPEGCLTKAAPDEDARKDIAHAVKIAKALGACDVGQAVVVQQGIVLAVEAVEGTDALLARCAGLRREGKGGVLVKCAKPQQDKRLDLPTIGPDTIRAAEKAGLVGIAVEAGASLCVARDEVVRLANDGGLFVIGLPLTPVESP